MYGRIHSTGDDFDGDDFPDKPPLLLMSPADYHNNNNNDNNNNNNNNDLLLQVDYSDLQQYEYPLPSVDDNRPIPSSAFDQYSSEGLGSTSKYYYNHIPNSLQQTSTSNEEDEYDVIKARISSHPCYPKLLNAYIDCQKVGAPPEIGVMLEEIKLEKDHDDDDCVVVLGLDPELDDFMETYYDVLVKYKTDLSRPIDEATSFLTNIQTQLANLCKDDDALSSDEEFSVVEQEMPDPNVRIEDRKLKDRLLRRFGNHINSLKVEFSKKKKKGKLPKEARQTLIEWWSVHYKWPYPTEVDKISLAETTGLDQKQINNWFINQRKRHWKPSENMHLAMMDNLFAHNYILED